MLDTKLATTKYLQKMEATSVFNFRVLARYYSILLFFSVKILEKALKAKKTITFNLHLINPKPPIRSPEFTKN